MTACRPELARADVLLSASELREKYRTEHPQYLRRQWDAERCGETEYMDYWQWVEQQLEENRL